MTLRILFVTSLGFILGFATAAVSDFSRGNEGSVPGHPSAKYHLHGLTASQGKAVTHPVG